jgi:hypothetical protein
VFSPVGEQNPYSTIAVTDVAYAAACLLCSPGRHIMMTMPIAAPPINNLQLCQTFSKVRLGTSST